MKTGRALLAVLTGLAAGAALGVIFSPQNENRSGRKMRSRNAKLGAVLSRQIDEKFRELEAKIAARRDAEHQK